ncbi:MAG TPA: hypothetical protein VI759_00145 [Dehalococcoidia bacterium]|nr:hypothetical protein [Dehalococcoidia bacterium]
MICPLLTLNSSATTVVEGRRLRGGETEQEQSRRAHLLDDGEAARLLPGGVGEGEAVVPEAGRCRPEALAGLETHAALCVARIRRQTTAPMSRFASAAR